MIRIVRVWVAIQSMFLNAVGNLLVTLPSLVVLLIFKGFIIGFAETLRENPFGSFHLWKQCGRPRKEVMDFYEAMSKRFGSKADRTPIDSPRPTLTCFLFIRVRTSYSRTESSSESDVY